MTHYKTATRKYDANPTRNKEKQSDIWLPKVGNCLRTAKIAVLSFRNDVFRPMDDMPVESFDQTILRIYRETVGKKTPSTVVHLGLLKQLWRPVKYELNQLSSL